MFKLKRKEKGFNLEVLEGNAELTATRSRIIHHNGHRRNSSRIFGNTGYSDGSRLGLVV